MSASGDNPCYNPDVFGNAVAGPVALEPWRQLREFITFLLSLDQGQLWPLDMASRVGRIGPPTAADLLDEEVSKLKESIFGPLRDVLTTLQGLAQELLDHVVGPASRLAASVADYGNDASDEFRQLATLVQAPDADHDRIVTGLRALAERASKAGAATGLAADVQGYVDRFEGLREPIQRLSQTEAQVSSQIQQLLATAAAGPEILAAAAMPVELPSNQLGQALTDLETRITSTALPALETIEGGWTTIAAEMTKVADAAEAAGKDAFDRQPCLAAVVLTEAADMWATVARNAAALAGAA